MKRRIAALVFALALMPVPAPAQGCAMCYESAKHAGDEGQRALQRAVTVLLLPPVGIMGVIIGFAFLGSRKDEEQPDRRK